MDRSGASMVLAAVGLVVMLCGFAAYAFVEPSTAWIVLFAAGLIVLIAAYAVVNAESKRTARELDEVVRREAVEGYDYYLDGGPEENGAEIEDLTRR